VPEPFADGMATARALVGGASCLDTARGFLFWLSAETLKLWLVDGIMRNNVNPEWLGA